MGRFNPFKLLLQLLGSIFLLLIKIYQYLISPMLGASCRFTPTCSQYGVEAIQKYGPFKGLWLTVKRIGRCHPWENTGMIRFHN